LLDHYHALVRAICAKLNQGAGGAQSDDRIGGSTYSFDVWEGHPLKERVSGLLAKQRSELSTLWNEVARHNETHQRHGALLRVTHYFGQLVTETDEASEGSA
jgi:hypothetical protein